MISSNITCCSNEDVAPPVLLITPPTPSDAPAQSTQRADAPSGTDARSGSTPPPPTTLPSADPEQVVPVPDSSTLRLPSPPVQESAQGEKRDAAGAATAEKKASPTATRLTTGGKSLQTMEKLLGKKYKVNLKMKGITEAEQKDEDDELMEELEDGSYNSSDWEPEEELRKSGATRRKQKKCHVRHCGDLCENHRNGRQDNRNGRSKCHSVRRDAARHRQAAVEQRDTVQVYWAGRAADAIGSGPGAATN